MKENSGKRFLGVPGKVIIIILALKLIPIAGFIYGKVLLPKSQVWGETWMVKEDMTLAQNMANFDGAWYIRLASVGYRGLYRGSYDYKTFEESTGLFDYRGYEEGKKGYGYKYFPLYPGLIKLFKYIFSSYLASALIISNLCGIVFLVFIYRIGELEWSETAATRAVVCAGLYPSALFMSAAYAEPLLMALAAGSYYYARRSKWWIAAPLAGILCTVRVEAFLAVLPVAYEYILQKSRVSGSESDDKPGSMFSRITGLQSLKSIKIDRGVINFLWIPAAIMALLGFFWHNSGDAIIFHHAHKGIVDDVGREYYQGLLDNIIYGLKSPGIIIRSEIPFWFYVFLTAVGFYHLRRSLSWYMVAFIVVFFVPTMDSGVRYLLTLYPMYFVLGRLFEERDTSFGLYCGISGGLLMLYSAMFIQAHWIA